MKRVILVMSIVICFAMLTSVASAQYVLARFRLPQQEALENYMPGGLGDVLTSSTYFQRSWDPVGPSGGWLANQFNAPDIASPSTEGPEGGNALFGNSNDTASTREGYWIAFAPPITGSFTFEVFFYLDELDPAYCEYKMQNIVSSFWMTDNKAVELRFFGPTSPLGAKNTLELMTSDGGAEHNINTSTGAISADTWYYAAVVYDNIASQISLYLADASDPQNINPTLIGTADPNWSSFTMAWLCLAAWPNPAGSCRDITGYIDAFGFSYSALSSSNFLLLNLPPLPTFTMAQGHWNLYE